MATIIQSPEQLICVDERYLRASELEEEMWIDVGSKTLEIKSVKPIEGKTRVYSISTRIFPIDLKLVSSTRVLTKRGWKYPDELESKDEIAYDTHYEAIKVVHNSRYFFICGYVTQMLQKHKMLLASRGPFNNMDPDKFGLQLATHLRTLFPDINKQEIISHIENVKEYYLNSGRYVSALCLWLELDLQAAFINGYFFTSDNAGESWEDALTIQRACAHLGIMASIQALGGRYHIGMVAYDLAFVRSNNIRPLFSPAYLTHVLVCSFMDKHIMWTPIIRMTSRVESRTAYELGVDQLTQNNIIISGPEPDRIWCNYFFLPTTLTRPASSDIVFAAA